MPVNKSLQQIIDHVKTIVNDVPADLEARIETDVQRAQEDAEDFWDLWPFLNDKITFETTQYQFSQNFSGSNISSNTRERWLRYRTEAIPWYVYDGVSKPVQMSWSNTQRGYDSSMGGMESAGDLDEIRTYTEGTVTGAGPPKYIGIVYEDEGGDFATPNHPRLFYIDPPCDLGPAGDPGVFRIYIPIQLRQPQLSTSGTTQNYWTRYLARYLENAAAANFLATNQDPRYLEYRNMAQRELLRHKGVWKRRMFRQPTLIPKSGQYGTRHTTRLQ